MNSELGLTHNAAMKIGLRRLLFHSKAGPAWVFSSDATDVLRDLWSDAAQAVEERHRRSPDGLEASDIREIEGYFVRIFRFPTPSRVAENHFAAIAYRPERRLLFWKGAPASLRYVTLEYGESILDGRIMTVLGEWTAETHVNYGEGPEPTVENFSSALPAILARALDPAAISSVPRS